MIAGYRDDDCLKIKKYAGAPRGMFHPDSKYCKHNCNMKNCKWYKK